jgi:DNA-binding HxlR family transcriptional regulator
MTKTALCGAYRRLLLTAHIKPDPARCFSHARVLLCSEKGKPLPEQPSVPPPSPAETTKVEREERMGLSGEMLDRPKMKHPKVMARPLNFEDARELAVKTMGRQRKFLEDKLESLRIIFGGQPDAPRTPDEEWYYKRVSFWMKRYENFVGLTEVKAAQARVVESERKFVETQEMRREAQIKISDVQKRLKDIHLELEKTLRGEDRYLVLVTQEHQVLKEEKNIKEEFKFFEKSEREYFSSLSNAVRDSHEKERAQAEKTKYWSVLGSIIGTCIGILGTTINNRMRMNELRRLVSQNSSVEEIQAIGSDLKEDFSGHRDSLHKLVLEVQDVVEAAANSLQNLDKMEELFNILKDSSDKINTRVLDQTVEELRSQQELLSKVISEHREQVDMKLEELQGDMFVQNKNVGQLTHITLKDREKELKASEQRDAEWRGRIEALYKQNEGLKEVLGSNTKAIEEKMKDVRSLLLAQTQLPRETEKWTEKLDRNERMQMELMEEGFVHINKKLDEAAFARTQALNAIQNRIHTEQHSQPHSSELHLLELDSVTMLLNNHQKKTQQSVIMSALVVGILTPVLVFSFSKLL